MTLVFTLCSVNYLAQAITLGDSLKEQNPDTHFIIGLVDKLGTKEIDQSKLPKYQLLEVNKINISDFDNIKIIVPIIFVNIFMFNKQLILYIK
jgi:hypothetical protein